MTHFVALFRHRFRLFWRGSAQLYHGLLFFLLAVLVTRVVAPTLGSWATAQAFFMLSVFTLFLMTEDLWAYFHRHGLLEAYHFMPFSGVSFVVCQYILYGAGVVLPLLGLNALLLWMAFPEVGLLLGPYTIGLGLTLMALLLIIFTNQAFVLSAQGASRFLVILLTLPLLLPWFMLSFGLIFYNEGRWAFLLGLYFVFLPCFLYATAWALKQAHE